VIFFFITLVVVTPFVRSVIIIGGVAIIEGVLSLFSESKVPPSLERGRQGFISSSKETSSSSSDEKSSVDEESSSSLSSLFVLYFFIDVVDCSTSSSSRSRLLLLEVIVFSVMRSVVLERSSPVYM
jgi:hypothetical protein